MSSLMVQGTTSDAGKSALVCGLGRVLHRKGLDVAPFKSQNMALNSAVTIDGGEIGRAQAVQAQACGLEPIVDMNPVLIKPTTDKAAQIIVHGRPADNLMAGEYLKEKPSLLGKVLESWERLKSSHSVLLVEGAGSPAEINLRKNDIANMGFAEAVDCPVILIADIDRGGVFAHLVGTLALLSESEQARVKGFVINKFRGDIAILEPGLEWLERRTGKPVLGVLPYKQDLYLEAEDGFSGFNNVLDLKNQSINVVVPVLPRISNHTDFEPLILRDDVDFRYVRTGQEIPPADLVILPGSKSVQSDYEWLQKNGWEEYLSKHLRYDGKLLGICGGFQMLGTDINDPHGIEGKPGKTPALNYFCMNTVLEKNKQLINVQGRLVVGDQPCTGYEIHTGISRGKALETPAINLNGRYDGALSDDGQIMGTYLHGLFDNPKACSALLSWAGLKKAKEIDHGAVREKGINDMADLCERYLNMDKVMELLKIR